MEDTLALFFEEQDFVFTIYTVVTLNYLQKA